MTPTTSWVTSGPFEPRGNARRVLNHLDGIQCDAAHHFRSRAGAHDQRISGGAGSNQGSPESAREREHGDEDAHGSRDAEHRNDRGSPTRSTLRTL